MSKELQRQQGIGYQALRLLKYLYRLGPVRGSLTWARLQLSRRIVAVKLPGFRAALSVRPHSSDVWTFEKIFISEEYDLSFLRPEPQIIVDAGANVGYASVYFAEHFPSARIIALEPQASNFSLLQRNTASYSNVTPVRAALWPYAAQLVIDNPYDDPWAFRMRVAPDANGERIRGVSMDELLKEHGLPHVDILKIDIEGAEKDVFRPGCEKWLAKIRILVVELHDWLQDGCGTAFYRATSQLPFRHYNAGENVILVRAP